MKNAKYQPSTPLERFRFRRHLPVLPIDQGPLRQWNPQTRTRDKVLDADGKAVRDIIYIPVSVLCRNVDAGASATTCPR